MALTLPALREKGSGLETIEDRYRRIKWSGLAELAIGRTPCYGFGGNRPPSRRGQNAVAGTVFWEESCLLTPFDPVSYASQKSGQRAFTLRWIVNERCLYPLLLSNCHSATCGKVAESTRAKACQVSLLGMTWQ
jgi:hypothetical protein